MKVSVIASGEIKNSIWDIIRLVKKDATKEDWLAVYRFIVNLPSEYIEKELK